MGKEDWKTCETCKHWVSECRYAPAPHYIYYDGQKFLQFYAQTKSFTPACSKYLKKESKDA